MQKQSLARVTDEPAHGSGFDACCKSIQLVINTRESTAVAWSRMSEGYRTPLTGFIIALLALLLTGCGGGDSKGSEAPNVDDPLFVDQWHLRNTGQKGGKPGEDINVEPVWNTYLGNGVRIAIVDDGLEIAHEDLVANVIPGASHNYVTGGTDPTPPLQPGASAEFSHGTSIAGLAAATGFNGIGVRGVAPEARIVSYNYLRAPTASHEADAMVRGSSNIAVSSNSWGAPDSDGLISLSDANWQQAVTEGGHWWPSWLGNRIPMGGGKRLSNRRFQLRWQCQLC